MSDARQVGRPRQDEGSTQEPSTEELTEPSTEKEPDEVPTAERPQIPEPDHRAVGIGVIDGPDEEAGGASDEASRK